MQDKFPFKQKLQNCLSMTFDEMVKTGILRGNNLIAPLFPAIVPKSNIDEQKNLVYKL